MAGPSPGSLVSSGQNGSLHNVLFYLPRNGNGNQFANEACHNQHGGTLNHLSYMQTSHNRYRPDPGLNKVHCFPSDNPYSCDRDTNGSYWSYQQQQWNQWNQNDYNHSESFKSCWMQQQQQQPMQQRQAIQNNNPSCMGFNPQYNHMHQQQQQQLHSLQQQQQIQPQQQHVLQQSGYRNNVMATVTVQSSAGSSQSSLSRTPSRCDSVRSESTCESHCSSSLSGGSSTGIEDMTGQQQYGMYQNFSSVQQLEQQQQPYTQPNLHQHQEHVQQQMQQQQQQQCFWPSSHYDVQQQEQQQQQMDYFRQQQQMQHQQQQQQHYYRQHQVIQQQQQVNCYWPRESSPVSHQPQQQQRQFTCVNPAVPVVDHHSIVIETPTCSSSSIVADTTTSVISSSPLPVTSSSSSPPVTSHYNHPATPVESMESVSVRPVGCDPPATITTTDESIESSSSVNIPTPEAADTNANVNTTTIVSVTTISVPAGWTREISAGSVIYISPSGCRLSSLNDAANYVQRDGTCKCGLPCPLRLQHVFNFDPSVACTAEPSPDAQSSNCCHKQPQDVTTDKTIPATTAPTVTTATSKAAVKRKKSGNGINSKTGKSFKLVPVVQQPIQQPHQQPLLFRRSPCPNVDVRQIPLEQNRPPTGSLLPQTRSTQSTTVSNNGPTFFEDPSAYLAQQTVLLQSSLQNSGNNSAPSPPPIPESVPVVAAAAMTTDTAEVEQAQEELLGDLLDCIPDSMEEVLDRQKDVAAAAEAAAQAEKAANLVKHAAATAASVTARQQQQQTATIQLQQTTTTKSHKLPSVPVSLAPAPQPIRSKPPPLAIRPATPASAARSRQRAAETTSKSTKSRSPRRTHHQPIQIQSNAKVLQPAQLPQQQLQQQQQQFIHQQQQHQFWPALSAPNIGPLRTASFPFVSYHSGVAPGTATPIFSTAALRPGNLPMTFLTSAATHQGNPTHATNVFNQALPVLTTRPALGPSGQVVHVLTTPGPMLAAAPMATEPSNAVPILTVGPVHTNNNNNSRGLTRTGKKRKSSPQTVASILQQGAQLAQMGQQQLHPQQQQQHHHQATTLTLSQEPLLYNVQNFQHIQPQQTIQTLALMPDGKTYVVVNSQPAPAPQPTHQQNTGGHWLLSPRPANIAPAGQPVNVFCTTQTGPGGATTFVLNGASAPTHQVLQLQDGTLVQTTTTTDQPNLLANYGGLFIRCPSTSNGPQIFSTASPAAANVRTLPLPIPIAPGRSPGRSPDSSSILTDGAMVTSSSTTITGNTSLVACGEATPPSQISSLSTSSSSLAVRTAHPSPVVQSSQIDSCVQEVETDQQHAQVKALKSKSVTIEFNNNNNGTTAMLKTTTVQHWLKPDIITNASQIVAG